MLPTHILGIAHCSLLKDVAGSAQQYSTDTLRLSDFMIKKRSIWFGKLVEELNCGQISNKLNEDLSHIFQIIEILKILKGMSKIFSNSVQEFMVILDNENQKKCMHSLMKPYD